jgi:hypothetical protein
MSTTRKEEGAGFLVSHLPKEAIMPANKNRPADQLLVAQCQAGNRAAWEQLHARLRDRAPTVLDEALGHDALNQALREEITVDVLTDLFVHKRLLLAYRPGSQSLDRYLDYLLRRQVHRYYQPAARHGQQHARLAQEKGHEPEEIPLPPGALEELIQQLTDTEKSYLEWQMLPPQEASPCPFSAEHARKLDYRIRKKVHSLFHGE